MWTTYRDQRSVSEDQADDVMARTVELLARRGNEQAVALLVDARLLATAATDDVLRVEKTPVGGFGTPTTHTRHNVYARVALLDVEEHLVPRFTAEVLDRIAEVMVYVMRRLGGDDPWSYFADVRSVAARPALPEADPEWRTTQAARLGQRPSNQGRKERNLLNLPVQDGFTFASREELTVYQALIRLQQASSEDRTIAVLPLPGARLRTLNTRTPDLVVVGNGRAVVFEVDGPHHRAGHRLADDRNLDLQWERCGVGVVRLPVEDLADLAQLEARLREELNRRLYPAR
jgi:hypothetical protein